MEKNTLLTIIIPVYNSFKLMDKCLNSLQSQTSNDFETIFVDDCSTDDSFQLLSEWLKANSTFKYKIIKNNTNSGPGFSRNNGIIHSKSNYLTFIDSDDYVEYDFVETAIKNIKKYRPDMIFFNYYTTDYINKKKSKSLLSNHYGELSVNEALALSSGMCWGKIFKVKIIKENQICFPNLMRSEDLAFVKVYISKCKEIFYLNDAVYYYYVENSHSIMHSVSTMSINNNIEAFKYIQSNIKDNLAVEMIFIREYLYLIVQILVLNGSSSKEIKNFISESNKIYKNWYKNPYLKYQPLYLRMVLSFIKMNLVFPIRLIFKIKKFM